MSVPNNMRAKRTVIDSQICKSLGYQMTYALHYNKLPLKLWHAALGKEHFSVLPGTELLLF